MTQTEQEIRQQIGRKIRCFRKARGHTLTTFAQVLHCSKSTVSKYERGEISIDVCTLIKISGALQVSLSMLLGEEAMGAAHLFRAAGEGGDTPVRTLYCYLFSGHKRAYLSRSVLLLGQTAASFYAEVASEKDYQNCKYYYFGEVQRTESFCRLLLVNSVLENDIVILEFLPTLNQGRAFTGFFCTLSVGQYFPLCCKAMLSETCITDEAWLKSQLSITKEDVKNYRLHNGFFAPFEFY